MDADGPLDDVSELERQRNELLRQREEKTQQLVDLLPVQALLEEREVLLAIKAKKERELAEAQNKNLEGRKKRGRPKKDETSAKRAKTLPSLADPQPTSTSWSYFQELKLEHKRGRKLLKDQQLKVDGFEKQTLQSMDNFQANLNTLLNHVTFPQ